MRGRTVEPEEIMRLLAEPFEAGEVKWKPAVVSGNRAMALAYVDARVIQDRLDEVMGATGWQDEYDVLTDGSVTCKLRLRLGDEWIMKMDVGGPSEQPDGGDRMKAAFSDALKRAAVKFGVGRYLYRLPMQWVDYDPAKKHFKTTPSLPAWAHKQAAAPEPKAESKDRKAGQAILLAAKTLDDLALAWKSLTQEMRKECADVKDAIKAKLSGKEPVNAAS